MARALAVLAVVPAAVYGRNYGTDTWRIGNTDCGTCMWDPNCRAGCGGTLVNGVSCAASAKAWCGLTWSWNQCKHTCCHYGMQPVDSNYAGKCGLWSPKNSLAACNAPLTCPGNNPVTTRQCLHCASTCCQQFKNHHVAEKERANLPGIPEGDETAVKEEVMSAGKAPQTSSSAFFFFALGAVAMFVMTYVHQNSRKAAPEAPEAASESYGTVA